MRKAVWLGVLFLALAVPAGAAQDRDLVMSRTDLVKSSYAVGKMSVNLRAQADVNVSDLLTGVNLTAGETAQSIHAKVDAQRKRLYPNKEVILTITIPKAPDSGQAVGSYLVRAIYWWNNVNAYNNYWYATYTSSVATMFIDDVKYGKYRIYDKVGSGSWIYRYLVSAGGGATRYSTGAVTARGFKGLGVGTSNKADVVMYFFR